MAVSGLRVQTTKDNLLRSFGVKYSKYDLVSSDKVFETLALFEGTPTVCPRSWSSESDQINLKVKIQPTSSKNKLTEEGQIKDIAYLNMIPNKE